jgi:hypothetical protein
MKKKVRREGYADVLLEARYRNGVANLMLKI